MARGDEKAVGADASASPSARAASRVRGPAGPGDAGCAGSRRHPESAPPASTGPRSAGMPARRNRNCAASARPRCDWGDAGAEGRLYRPHSCTYRIALGPRAGQKVLSLRSLPSAARASTPELRVNAHGFSLHAALRWRADQRLELEQLCRNITRPAIADERLKRNRAGQVVLQLKSPYKDGTTHIVMEPLEFMERLAALVPRPRLHLIRFHGVLAPNAKLRSKIVPAPASPATESPSEDAHGQGAPARMS